MFAKFIIGFAVVCAVVGTLNAADVDANEVCPKICPLLYAPVCGTDGLNFKEFSNPCELKAHNCHLERGLVKPMVATVLDMCRTEMVGSLSKLLTKLGNLDLAKAECSKVCPLLFQPVCISNGKFRFLASNKCIMNTINCALGEKDTFSVLQNGSC